MTSRKDRLSKIQLSLSPKKAVFDVLENEMNFRSLDDCIAQCSRPQHLERVNQRWEKVEQSIRQQLRGQPKKTIDRAVLEAMENIAFLMTLYQVINTSPFEDLREKEYKIVCIAMMWNVIIRDIPEPLNQKIFEEILVSWGPLVCQVLIREYSEREANQLILNTYFEGRSLLFPETIAKLETVIEVIEGLTEAYNQGLPFLQKFIDADTLVAIDLAELKNEGRRLARSVAKRLLLKTKAEVYLALNKKDEARSLYLSMLNLQKEVRNEK